MAVSKVSEDFWAAVGESVDKDAVSPLSNPTLGVWEEIRPGTAFLLAFGNVSVFGECCVRVFAWRRVSRLRVRRHI